MSGRWRCRSPWRWWRAQPLLDAEYARQVALKAQIIATLDAPAHHLGIRRFQEIVRANADRLYHWTNDRWIPAENHRADRDLRPTVSGRNVRCSSPSDAGAHASGIVMAVWHTAGSTSD